MTIEKVKEFYWKTLNQDSISTPREAEMFEQALILLDLEEEEAKRRIIENPNIQKMFEETQYINILEEESGDDSLLETSEEEFENVRVDKTEQQSDSEDERIIEERLRNLKNKGVATEEGENSKRGQKRKGEFYPNTSEFKINPGPYGANVLYLDCITSKKDRKQKIDIWAKEISLIIQTNPEQYDDQASALLLLDHKTAGIANSVLKETWVPTLSPVTTFNNVINTFYTLFLGVDFITSKNVEENKIKEKAKDSLLNT